MLAVVLENVFDVRFIHDLCVDRKSIVLCAWIKARLKELW